VVACATMALSRPSIPSAARFRARRVSVLRKGILRRLHSEHHLAEELAHRPEKMGGDYPHKSVHLFSYPECSLRTVHPGLLRLVVWCQQPGLKETSSLSGNRFFRKINGLRKSIAQKWGMSCMFLDHQAETRIAHENP